MDLNERLAQVIDRYQAASDRCLLGLARLDEQRKRTPHLSSFLGEHDLGLNKELLKTFRELGEDYMATGRYLRQIADLAEPRLDEFLVEARKIGRK